MKHCCELMKKRAENTCSQHQNRFDCGDCLIAYDVKHGYGIIVHDGGYSKIVIHYCPWCGVRLPDERQRIVDLANSISDEDLARLVVDKEPMQ